MKNFLKGLWGFVEVIIIIYVICITACLLCTNKYGLYLEESKENDLIIVRGESKDINVGDKIYYYGTAENKYTIRTAHVKEIVSSDDSVALYKLDDDLGTTIATTRVIGKYSAIYHNIGGILDVLESKLGFLFLVILPILIIFMYQIYALIVVVKYGDDIEEEKPTKKEIKKDIKPKKEEKKAEKKEKDDEIELL